MPAVTRQIRTQKQAYGEFVQHGTPRLLALELLLLLTTRLVVADWSWNDVLVVAVLVGLQPFTEWLIHVFVLHCPADGRLRDRIAGYSHRRHHEDPRDLRYQFIHPRVVYVGIVVTAVIMLAFRTPTAVTGVLAAAVLTLVYEWVHFLIHTDYAPKRELYRRLHRAHRLHHYRNENYWLGVTARTGDRVLRTNPRKEDVEISPTARTALARRGEASARQRA
ncbi:MAG: hypothetical protein JWM02_2463 [Frankiales bacterium]|nr:hypothetical protein [Frankiales bacterium]